MSYDGFVVGTGAPDHSDVRSVRRNNKTPVYLSGLVLCGKTACSILYLSDIEHSRYLDLNELISGRIGDVNPVVHRGNDGNSFVGGFVSNEFIVNTNHSPHVNVLHATIAKSVENYPASL